VVWPVEEVNLEKLVEIDGVVPVFARGPHLDHGFSQEFKTRAVPCLLSESELF
jgi:hypothetical protein